ncbi:hypothetical protein [Zoogloea sp.]|jgi:hypothetical protein|uniref:hypothetical protein n=1 Tax=Zoogloea sp. TaxID=49181 RepID=UPI001DE00606|nr:hypothetical protein [Zoogloea sp.]MBK6654426.1 hypothetical protein [Zoogloea sp.]
MTLGSATGSAQRGMMLPALVLLLSLGGLGWLLARHDTAADRAAHQLAADLRTERALQTAREALLGFAATYRNKEHPTADFGYLPCPDLDGDGSSETCGQQGQPVVGRLPYLTLNLPDLRDGSGECLWYAVSGAFKNNPKAQSVNWDSTGSFRLRDGDARVIALPGDQAGLAAALVIAPGRPLASQQRTPGPGRCGGDPEARRIEAYLEVIGTSVGNTPFDVPTDHPASNDRLVAIATGDIYRQLKRRNSYGGHLQKVFQSLADCLITSKLPAPVGGEDHGPVRLGQLPAPDGLQGPCRNPELRDPAANWAGMMRYARCNDGSTCLTGAGQACRGALIFGGERLDSQHRLAPPAQQGNDAYLEDATLAALAAGQIGTLPARIDLSSTDRHQPASRDAALCLP